MKMQNLMVRKQSIICVRMGYEIGWLVGFVALRPKSTAMVIAGRSVHLTTLFPGQARKKCPIGSTFVTT